MTGSLQIKNGMYYAVINIYENGKRKQKWVPTMLPEKGNKRKAEKFLRDEIQKFERLSLYPKSDVLFSDYIRSWLCAIKRTVDEITYQGYEVLATSQILPYFDATGTTLQNICVDDLQKYIDEKHASGRVDGKGGLSPRSLKLHKNILNQTLKLAVKNGLIPSNPCEFVILPRTERYEASFYTAEQMQSLFEAIKDDEIYPMVKITAIYGLRRSELLGLQWDSVDFDNGLFTIRHTVSKVTKTVEKDKTKNATSYRSFPLTEEAREIFQEARQHEAENRKLFGRAYNDNPYIFKWSDGHPYSPDYVTKHFSSLLRKHKLPHIRFHELRHSCASLLINSGFSLKDVQEWLGHADIKMTANIYGHLDVSRKKSMADKLSAMC